MIFKKRRAYSAPTTYLLGGSAPEGMDASGRADLPPARAAYAENLWRIADGSVCKRPGIRLVEKCGIPGRVEWMLQYANARFYYYIGEMGGVLRRVKNGVVQERSVTDARPLKMGKRLFIFCVGAWIVVEENGITTLITADGSAVLTNDFTLAASPWSISSTVATIPLTHAGGRPQKQGRGILPANLLIPLVSESFVYTKSDQEAKHNRFSLSFAPQVKGSLPTNADGTHGNLSDQDNAIRKATLSASARLEVRLEKTDAYGNTVSYWSKRSWSATDNINAADAAVWINSIHSAALSYDGDDNVRITYFRPALQETAQLLSAHTATLFGVGGLKDRIFAATGSRLYYSGMDDGLYFGSLQYMDLGEKILLLGGQESVLTALSEHSAWRIEGQAEQQTGEYALDAFFSVLACFPSPRPYGRECIVAGNELLFYSERGVCAVAPSGVLDERNVQVRSARLWRLLQQENPECIRMATQGDRLFLAGEKGVYLFDLQRRVKVEDDAYSTHGYEGYFWSGLGAQSFMSKDEQLLFFRQGDLYTLANTGKESDYHDEYFENGELVSAPIVAVWETAPMGDVTRCGTFYGLHIATCAPCMMRISFKNGSLWQCLFDYDGTFSVFDYGALRYGMWNYGSVLPAGIRRAMMLRHRRTLQLRFENDITDSALRMRSFAVEYK